MKIKQNDVEHLQDMIQRGLMTTDEANVEMVLIQRVRLVTGKLPQQVRNALNAAVSAGKLLHMKKDGHKPEAYYNPTFEHLARQERAEYEYKILISMHGILTN